MAASAAAPSVSAVQFTFDPPLRGVLHRVGVLFKLSSDEKKKQWKPRLCAITDHGDLHCLRPSDTSHSADSRVLVNTSKQLRGSINCREAVVRMLDAAEAQSLGQTHAAFSIQPMDDSHRVVLAASTLQERDEWIKTLSQFGDGPSLAPASLPNAKARLLLYGETASPNSASASPNGAGAGAGAGSSVGGSAHAHSSALPSGSGAHPALVPQLSHPPRTAHGAHKELATLGISLAAYELFKNSEKLYQTLGVGHAEHSHSLTQRGERSRSSAMDMGGGSAGATSAATAASAAAASSSSATATAAPAPVAAATPAVVVPASPAAHLCPANLASILLLRDRLPSPLLHPSESPCIGIAIGGARIYWMGWLTKFGGKGTFASWQRRYFILTSAGLLHYWATPELMAGGKPVKGTIDATHSVIRFADEREPGMVPHAFTVQPATPAGARRYALAADTLSEQETWVSALSHFGDGPATIPSRAHGAPLLSAKAKDVLFGGNKKESGCAAYDKLGTNRQTLETFALQPKAFAKLGIFDGDAPPSTQRGSTGATAATTLNVDPAGAAASSASSSPSHAAASPILCPALPVMDRFNPTSNLLLPDRTRRAGWMAKRGSKAGSGFRAKSEVKARYCILTSEALVYFASNTDSQPRGQILLEPSGSVSAVGPSLLVGVPSEFEDPFNPNAALAASYPSALAIRHARPQNAAEERIFTLYAPSDRERDAWIEAIGSVIAEQHANRLRLMGETPAAAAATAESKEAQG